MAAVHDPGEERRSLAGSSEGRILILGLLVTVAGMVAVLSVWRRSPGSAQVLLAMTATNIVFGRATGLSFGYAAGLGSAPVTLINMLVETVLVLLFYPLFVLSWSQLLVVRPLRKLMERTNRAAEAHRDSIRRYGILGLFFFVWFPFWLTGPVVGCALGFLLGLRPWLNLTVVLGGTYLAILCWSLFLGELQSWMAGYGPYAPYGIVATIVLLVILGQYWHRRRARRSSGRRSGRAEV